MKRNWLGMVIWAMSAVACGGGSSGGTSSSSSGTTGGAAALGPGSACSSNSQCASQICGGDGTGNCCASACSASEPICGKTACDVTGACTFVAPGTACDSCTDATLIPGACNGSGTCEPGIASPCPGDVSCNAAGTACQSACAQTSDCATGFYCSSGLCLAAQPTGACTENDACTSGICGAAGSGHCCAAACAGSSPCMATDCDDFTGACVYPGSEVTCGSDTETCSSGTQHNPSVCDGQGNCPAGGTTACAPFLCGSSACLTNCSDATSCVSGDFCDTEDSACCAPLTSGGSLTVDSVAGNDATGCCGIGANQPCQTLTRAMRLIDVAGADDVTINATVGDGGVDWAPAGEIYPVVLGRGVELNAPGVSFWAPHGSATPATLAVDFYSSTDSVGYASIVGSSSQPVGVGMNHADTQQSPAYSAIEVRAGQTLYIANANLNGNATAQTNAITVAPGGALMLAQDKSGQITGTVNIGSAFNQQSTDGFDGIYCETDNVGRGCTINDAPLSGKSSVVIQGQEGAAIVAQDFAQISLTSAPIIGVAPVAVGFNECPFKPDAASLRYSGAIVLQGLVSMTFRAGTVHCISADAFALTSTQHGAPSLQLEGTTIENTETALSVAAGSATVADSTFQFNYNGAVQGSSGMLDLSGGALGSGNTVICSSDDESIYGNRGLPGVNVLNQSKGTLNASNLAWDTVQPDQFSCGPMLVGCSCALPSCTLAAGVDGMDAVTEGGAITTADNTQSQLAVQNHCE